MARAVLQIPLDPALRIAAEKTAIEQGFSSLQEAVRVFLKQFVQKKVEIQLSTKAMRRYDKLIGEMESGKTNLPSFDNIEEMFAYLKGDNRSSS